MKREPRTEVVSIRLTKAERARVDALGGPATLLRKALTEELPPIPIWTITTATFNAALSMIWSDGTVGPNYPAVNTS